MLNYFFCFLFTIFFVQEALAADKYIKLNANMNMRTAPFFQSNSLIQTLRSSDNKTYKVLEEHSRYYKIQTADGKTGYIARGRRDQFTTVVNAPSDEAADVISEDHFTRADDGRTVTPPPATSDDGHGHDHVPETPPQVDVPDNVQKYCKGSRYYYFERECQRRGLEAKYCKNSRRGYHLCGTDSGQLVTEEDVNSGNEDTGGRRTGRRGSCGPGIYVAPPIKNGRTGNRRFGMYMHPILGYRRMHSGWDYPGSRNSKTIRASASGVVKCSTGSGSGKMVTINHGKGLSTKYMHLASRLKCNQRVARGTQIGVMGKTGLATGVHLHYGVYCNGSAVNPAHYVGLPTGTSDDRNGTMASN